MCSSRKNSHPLHGRSLEIPRGRGVLKKVKILKGKYEAKLEFSGGMGGVQNKKTCYGGSMDIFWNCRTAIKFEQNQ